MKNQVHTKEPRGKSGDQPKTENKSREPKPTGRRTPGMRFPEVEGKTLEWVELWPDDDDESYIELRFPDQTALLFVVQPYTGVNVSADYGGWKTGNWRRIKRYR